MNCIRVNNKYDFEELINILLKQGYTVTVTGRLEDEDGIEIPDADVANYELSFEQL